MATLQEINKLTTQEIDFRCAALVGWTPVTDKEDLFQGYKWKLGEWTKNGSRKSTHLPEYSKLYGDAMQLWVWLAEHGIGVSLGFAFGKGWVNGYDGRRDVPPFTDPDKFPAVMAKHFLLIVSDLKERGKL